MPRHQEPEHVQMYRTWLASGPPRCCHTCDHYNHDGLCELYNEAPPEDVAASLDECTEWIQEVPF